MLKLDTLALQCWGVLLAMSHLNNKAGQCCTRGLCRWVVTA